MEEFPGLLLPGRQDFVLEARVDSAGRVKSGGARIGPGAIAFTLTPVPTSSAASVSVSRATAAFGTA